MPRAWNGLVHMTFWSRTTFLTSVLKAPGGSLVATVPGVATRSAADSTLPLFVVLTIIGRSGLCERTHAEQNSHGDGPPEMPRQRYHRLRANGIHLAVRYYMHLSFILALLCGVSAFAGEIRIFRLEHKQGKTVR